MSSAPSSTISSHSGARRGDCHRLTAVMVFSPWLDLIRPSTPSPCAATEDVKPRVKPGRRNLRGFSQDRSHEAQRRRHRGSVAGAQCFLNRRSIAHLSRFSLANGAGPPMRRDLPALLGLTLGLCALAGCVQPLPPHAICPAFTTPPPVPSPAAVVTPPVVAWTPPWHSRRDRRASCLTASSAII